MPTLTSLLRGALLVLSYFALRALPVAAQSAGMQNATTVASSPQHVSNPQLAVDGDLQTASLLRPTLVGLFVEDASERVQFPATVVPGLGTSYIYLQLNKLLNPVLGNTIDASLLNSSKVIAYLNGRQVGNWSLGGLLKTTLLQEGQRTAMAIAPTVAYNQLELDLDGTLSAYSMNLYEAFAPTPPAPLPVQLAGFQAKPTAAGVQLSWTTASELNNHHFTVERASGTTGTFVALGQVAGAGSSSQARSYQFLDASPSSPRSYYRLRQVDAAGTESFSPVVAVQVALSTALAAYPSPATTSLTITSLPGTHLRLFNQQGQLVRQTVLVAGPQPLDLSGLPAGAYLLQDADSGQRLRIQKAD